MNEHYQILMTRFLSGEATVQERRELEHWLNADAEHRRLFAATEKFWQKAEPALPEAIPPFEEFWQELAPKLQKPPATIRRLTRGVSRAAQFAFADTWRWLAAAAILVVLIGSALFWHKLREAGRLKVIITKNAERRQIALADGSQVTLNAGSEIRFPKIFSDSSRVVHLVGQAFFEVASSSRPFIVQTANARVSVLGTGFEVWARAQKTRVIVKNGKVALHAAAAPAKKVIVQANEMAVCEANQPLSAPVSVNAEYRLGWLENRLVFDQTPVDEIAAELERFYGATIRVADPTIAALTLTGEFEKQPLEEVLSSICLSLNLSYRKQGREYSIMRKE